MDTPLGRSTEHSTLGEDRVKQQPSQNPLAQPLYHLHKIFPTMSAGYWHGTTLKQYISHNPRHAAFSGQSRRAWVWKLLVSARSCANVGLSTLVRWAARQKNAQKSTRETSGSTIQNTWQQQNTQSTMATGHNLAIWWLLWSCPTTPLGSFAKPSRLSYTTTSTEKVAIS